MHVTFQYSILLICFLHFCIRREVNCKVPAVSFDYNLRPNQELYDETGNKVKTGLDDSNKRILLFVRQNGLVEQLKNENGNDNKNDNGPEKEVKKKVKNKKKKKKKKRFKRKKKTHHKEQQQQKHYTESETRKPVDIIVHIKMKE